MQNACGSEHKNDKEETWNQFILSPWFQRDLVSKKASEITPAEEGAKVGAAFGSHASIVLYTFPLFIFPIVFCSLSLSNTAAALSVAGLYRFAGCFLDTWRPLSCTRSPYRALGPKHSFRHSSLVHQGAGACKLSGGPGSNCWMPLAHLITSTSSWLSLRCIANGIYSCLPIKSGRMWERARPSSLFQSRMQIGRGNLTSLVHCAREETPRREARACWFALEWCAPELRADRCS